MAVLFTPDPVAPPAEFRIVFADTGEQMIGTPAESAIRCVEVVPLGVDDAPAMVALTELTRPGPFTLRTHELGTFLGIRIDGQLVAMVGERIKPACTYFPTTIRPSRSTADKAWRSAVACT
jgi:hypothetical protein